MQNEFAGRPEAYSEFHRDESAELNPQDFIGSLCKEFQRNNKIDPSYYEKWDVKRGLRNADGTGVMAGVTQIGNVRGYYMLDG